MPRFFALFEAPTMTSLGAMERRWFARGSFTLKEKVAGNMVTPACVQEIGECELQPDFGCRGYIKVWLTVEAPSREALTVEGLRLAPFLAAMANVLGNGRLHIGTDDWWMNQATSLEPEAVAV